jgi:hypothetical protein
MQYICWLIDIITVYIRSNISKYNIVELYNPVYTRILFPKINELIYRIKGVVHKELLNLFFEHFCVIGCILYGSWQVIEEPYKSQLNPQPTEFIF